MRTRLSSDALHRRCPTEWVRLTDAPAELPFQARARRELTLALARAEGIVYLAGPVDAPLQDLLLDVVAQRGGLTPFVTEHYPTPFTLLGDPHHGLAHGSLARAQGGLLVVTAAGLLAHPASWPCLRQCLERRQIVWDPSHFATLPNHWVAPPPLPLSLRCVIIGTHEEYEQLAERDLRFSHRCARLADYALDAPFNAETVGVYSQWMQSRLVKTLGTGLTACGMARLMEAAARLAERQDRLSLRALPLLEAAIDALTLGAGDADAVDAAILGRHDALRQYEEQVQRDIRSGALDVPLEGYATGRTTAITLAPIHAHHTALVAKISATVRPGEGKLIDIERETEFGGPSHSKGVMILGAWLGWALAPQRSLSILAHLVCDQSHDFIDGDSASAAELIALLSALTQLPVSQSLAITGAIGHHGALHAVGGIDDKIEGYYRLCQALGLTDAGIVIPAANRFDLMLSSDVRAAIERETFAVHACDTVDDLIALMFGLPWEAGAGTADSVRSRALQRLDSFDRTLRDEPRFAWPRPNRDK